MHKKPVAMKNVMLLAEVEEINEVISQDSSEAELNPAPRKSKKKVVSSENFGCLDEFTNDFDDFCGLKDFP